MSATPLLVSPFSGLLTRLREWPEASQLQARRNAMIAATACAQRRAERDDVADFLAHLDDSAVVSASGASPAPPMSRAAATR